MTTIAAAANETSTRAKLETVAERQREYLSAMTSVDVGLPTAIQALGIDLAILAGALDNGNVSVSVESFGHAAQRIAERVAFLADEVDELQFEKEALTKRVEELDAEVARLTPAAPVVATRATKKAAKR